MKKLFAILVALLVLAAGVLLYRDYASTRSAAAPAGDAPGTEAPAASAPPGEIDTMIFWSEASGVGRRWSFTGSAAPAVQPVQQAGGTWVPIAMANRGWGGSDLILWLQPDDRVLHLWRVDANGNPSKVEEVPYRGTEWTVIALADANGDGDADLVWRDVHGGIAIWLLRDGRPTEQAPVGDAKGRTLAAVADLDGDKRDELVWRDDASGQVDAWTLDGVKTAESRTLSGPEAAWRPIGAVRLDMDAAEDLLWSKPDSLQYAVWLAGDASRAVLLRRPGVAGWTLAALADVDADGRADMVWTNDVDGSAGAWRLAADGSVTDLGLPALGREWTVIPDRVAGTRLAPDTALATPWQPAGSEESTEDEE